MMLVRFVGSIAAAGVLATVALAQQATSPVQQPEPGPAKIAFIDVERALAGTARGQASQKELSDWARPREEEIGKLAKEVGDLQGELNAKQRENEDALAELNRRFVAKQRELEDKQRMAKRELEEKRNSVLKDLGSKLQEVVARYADANHYTAVFILKPNDLAYLANSADITDAVIRLYNEKYPVAAAPAPAK